MKFIHNPDSYRERFTICLFIIGFLSVSCHNSNVKLAGEIKPADSASRKPVDTVTSKINYYTGIIASQSNNANAYWNRGKLEIVNKSYPPALADLTKAVALDSTKSEYYYNLADVEFLTGHTHEARDAFATCIRLDPKNTDAILKLAELYLYVEKYDDALTLINQALKVDQYIARAYFLKGMIYIEKHDTGRAISSIQTAIEQNPDYYDAYIQVGLLFAGRGNPIALSYYDNATNLEPQNPESYYDKGMFYQFGGDYDNAIKVYQELLEVDSTYKNAYYNLGVIYNEDKMDYTTSLNYFNKAIKYDTAYYMAYYGRANSYEMLKQYPKALTDYAHAYRINPKFKEAETAYQKLKSKTH
jgi:tetratricopeptide (TPR) repeat protein